MPDVPLDPDVVVDTVGAAPASGSATATDY
jgi:hypothetical protein